MGSERLIAKFIANQSWNWSKEVRTTWKLGGLVKSCLESSASDAESEGIEIEIKVNSCDRSEDIS